MLNSREIKDLHFIIANKAEIHQINCKKRGVDIIFTSTKRDDEYQAVLYAQGRTTPGSIVTNLSVTGGHGLGLAYDVVPVVRGVAIWDNDALWQIIAEEGMKLGLVWGGNWKSFVDKPHFELTDGIRFTDLRSGRRPIWFNYKTFRDYVQYRTGFETKTIAFLDAYKFGDPLFKKLAALL